MKELLFLVFMSVLSGYLIGSLHEKWKYFSKTGEHIQDVKQKK